MREIKFRAWDKIDKRLIIDKQDFIPLIVTNKGVFKLDPTCEYDRWIEIDKNRFDFMQYTGLKDKNGVEIYEGDIVRIEKCFTNGIDTLTDHIGEVKYLNCRFMVIDEYLNSLCPYEYKNQIEVIGNIYENPELLN